MLEHLFLCVSVILTCFNFDLLVKNIKEFTITVGSFLQVFTQVIFQSSGDFPDFRRNLLSLPFLLFKQVHFLLLFLKHKNMEEK